MFCPKCGEEQRENAKYCAKCGANLQIDPVDILEPEEETIDEVSLFRRRGGTSFVELLKGHKGIFAGVLAAAAGVVLIVGVLSVQSIQGSQLQDLLEAGNVYMEEGAYEEAVAVLQSAVEIDPRVIESYDMLEEAYLALGDTEAAEETHQKGLKATKSILGDTEKDSSTKDDSSQTEPSVAINDNVADTDTVSEEDVQNLLQTFSISTMSLLYSYYDDVEEGEEGEEGEDFLSSEELDDGQAYTVAALALIESEGEELYNTVSFFCYVDEGMVSLEEALGSEGSLREESLPDVEDNLYVLLPDEVYEQYICDLFGDEYPLEEFVEYEYKSEWGVLTRQDEEGQFYLKVIEMEDTSVQMDIDQMSSEPDEDGIYWVNVKYTEETREETREYYMQFQIAPDESSQYGCSIKGMIPAGKDALDSDYEIENSEEEAEYEESDETIGFRIIE